MITHVKVLLGTWVSAGLQTFWFYATDLMDTARRKVSQALYILTTNDLHLNMQFQQEKSFS